MIRGEKKLFDRDLVLLKTWYKKSVDNSYLNTGSKRDLFQLFTKGPGYRVVQDLSTDWMFIEWYN